MITNSVSPNDGSSNNTGTTNSASSHQKTTVIRVGNYDLHKTLGKGNFAIVKLATNLVTNSKVAIKIIDKQNLDSVNLTKTFREISVLKLLHHPHITRLYEVIESRNMIYLVTEYAPRGEIFDYLVANKRMPENEAARVFAQIVSAIDYCHTKGVVHRDLKLENLLLDDEMNVKLADFGFSNTFEPGKPLKTWCGSPPYAAPELFLGVEYDGPRADIWSLGVVLYALVAGGLPFDGGTVNELRAYVMGGKFRIPFYMSPECENLVRNMLVVEPTRRFSIRQVAQHKWIQMHTHGEDVRTAPEPGPPLDNMVVSHMLQLPRLSTDMIAQSVLESRFDRIYAIYYLLVDKLVQKRKEQSRAASTAAAYSRSRKASITTGVVVRDEQTFLEPTERLSPLTNVNFDAPTATILDPPVEITSSDTAEMEISPPASAMANMDFLFPLYGQSSAQTQAAGGGNMRRHTVGPGDVAHEQALAPCVPVPMCFRPGGTAAAACIGGGGMPQHNQIPTNLSTLQNQPLNLLTNKDQHLLKPPAVMGNTVAFGRRASDGGANLHIFYPSNVGPIPVSTQQQMCDVMGYQRGTTMPQRTADGSMQMDAHQAHQQDVIMGVDGAEGSCDEIQRYIRGRGSSKRHTVGCTDDLSQTPSTSGNNGSHSPAPSAGRVRKTGLLTVTERPPVISPDLIREVEARMNRNYLPPALKTNNGGGVGSCSGVGGGGQSPPHTVTGTSPSSFSLSLSSPSPLPLSSSLSSSAAVGGTTPPPPTPTITTASSSSLRRYAHCGNRVSKLSPVPEVGRYSPVRRASEGSKINTPFQGALQECQQLQKATQRHLLTTQSPPLADNSVSLPGSPIHGKPFIEPNAAMLQEIEVPPDMILSITPGLETLVQQGHITFEMAQQILQTHMVPFELGKVLGLVAHSAGFMDTLRQHSQSASPINNPKPPLLPLNLVSPGSSSPIYAHSGCASPNNGGGNASPMHQITRGISGLTTGGGSIMRGTSAVMSSPNEPLDLTMDVVNYEWYAPPVQPPVSGPSGYYNAMQRIVPTPPASPNLCIIQEENGHNGVTPVNCPQSTPTAENIDYLHSHPQICLTDVQGSEITLVALSDSSHDESDDSLEGGGGSGQQRHATTSFQGLVISEPSSDMPSITRGVGRKTSLENEAAQKLETTDTAYGRRGSDKSLGFSDDSLSNDSNLSPLQEPSFSSGFKSCDESRLSPDSLSDRRLSDECCEVSLPEGCSHLESSRILEMVKRKIEPKLKGYPGNSPYGGGGDQTAPVPDSLPHDVSNLNIEYPSGLQVELQITEGHNKDHKGIKLRRVSGDQLEYGKLCQQLITSLAVV